MDAGLVRQAQELCQKRKWGAERWKDALNELVPCPGLAFGEQMDYSRYNQAWQEALSHIGSERLEVTGEFGQVEIPWVTCRCGVYYRRSLPSYVLDQSFLRELSSHLEHVCRQNQADNLHCYQRCYGVICPEQAEVFLAGRTTPTGTRGTTH